jgi:hypothetical protein
MAPAASALLGILWVIEAINVVAASMPIRFAEAQWRFQFLAILLAAGPQLALLLGVICGIAVLTARRVTLKIAAITAVALAVALIIALPFFGLDFLTQRHLQTQVRLPGFDREAMRLAGSTALLVPFLLWTGVRGIAAARKDPTSQFDAERGLAVTDAGIPAA